MILLICDISFYLDSGCSLAGMVLVVCRGLEKDELEKSMQHLGRCVRVDISCDFGLPWEGGVKQWLQADLLPFGQYEGML